MAGMTDWKQWLGYAFYGIGGLMFYIAWERLRNIEKATERIEQKLDELQSTIETIEMNSEEKFDREFDGPLG
jgi:hypothetical protein